MMNTRTWITVAAASTALALAGCASGPNQQLGTGVGALGGAVIGNAIGGNTGATVGGAAIGGLIGNQVGRNADDRDYQRQQQPYYPYPQQHYYPRNGPHH